MKRNHLNALCFGLIVATFYTCRNTEALKCDPHTGPNGVRHCIKLPQYNDFQWSTCRTDLYIRAKTGGKHHCARRDITYCYYQCMLNVYGENGGDVYGSCRCSPDLNECVLGTHGCSVNGFCTNTSGSYTCQCNPGYTGNGFTCIDLNECVLGTHGCSVNGFCINTFGSYTCQCNPGYTGNGFTCIDKKEKRRTDKVAVEEEQEELVEQVVTQWSEAAVEEVTDGEATINIATIGQAAAMDFAAAVRVNGGEQPRVHPIRQECGNQIENPIVEVKVLYVPSEVPNKVVAEFLGNHGKVETITHEMTTEHGFPTIETGTRVAKMTDIKTDIPRKSRIGHFPVEIRHKGQLPQCFRCRLLGHRANECPNDVVCFKCGLSGHIRDKCFKCFRCGKFGHVRENCPELQHPRVPPASADGNSTARVADTVAPVTVELMETDRRNVNLVAQKGQSHSSAPVMSHPESQDPSTSQIPSESQVSPVSQACPVSHVSPVSQDATQSQQPNALLNRESHELNLSSLQDEGRMDLDAEPLKRGPDGSTWTEVRKKPKPK
ncbi:partial [Paramuricea clavata]|uniref:Partial n=1 Tax=Paramuricea clavata TaxID=317549 RepID=A0A7D9HI68_PARCT|nr:partial [Paramuricea clavata]